MAGYSPLQHGLNVITVFYKEDGGMHCGNLYGDALLPPETLWIDIANPDFEEKLTMERQLGISLPSREEVWKNELLNRFYMDNGVYYMTAALITKMDSPYPQTSAVTFILAPGYLLTIREISPTSFQNFSERMIRAPHKFMGGADVMEGLLEEIITRVAHNSETVVQILDALSHDIFGANTFETNRKNPSQLMQAVLRRLGTCADLNSKINESLQGLNRMVQYFLEVPGNAPEMKQDIRTLKTDIDALSKQTAFLSDKINFQLDATLGMINVEQNLIIKIFSVVAVFFLPPTMISSIYGMNFQFIPELHWKLGYPFALGIMTLCALIPYIYFRKKGWL